ncbi:thiamine pyrophosphate-binding protein [Amycolatopsis cihanbeyliensis]|uniref:Sulfopyruvate decarboxylase subunit alpha/phosphonopyruvate decarboxylase n=1 Tax=Amycolatopsis cihanbeyliensis TaxID=1128664 RepID=A0A542DFF7_AMYCI|nr:thiamine pyrophosphate-binding protein [Amycolatopsis cihanbeyliensis]TQJ01812.1 sulfopyruvate decarboxylase subunit alpha/phosphonopyruvate decarboxylase [Amycolatopsis cihanbeyliensis]
MTVSPPAEQLAEDLCGRLTEAGFGPCFGTPCGILSPLYRALERTVGMRTITREDNAVGVAVGASLAGRFPVVLMQNSGLGQSVNALASLVVPYRIPLLLVISLRGIDPDPTPENQVMGRLTEPLLSGLDIPTETVGSPGVTGFLGEVRRDRRAAALLVPPAAFGWRA